MHIVLQGRLLKGNNNILNYGLLDRVTRHSGLPAQDREAFQDRIFSAKTGTMLGRPSWPLFRGSSDVDQLGKILDVIGLPGEEDWPRDVALPRQAFHSKSPQPIEKFVTDIDEQGKDLLLIGTDSSAPAFGVKYRLSPCVLFWGPDQRGCGSLEHVLLMVEGRCSQEASRSLWWMPLKASWKSHPVTSVHISLAKASFMTKANFSKEYSSHGEKKGNMC
ncbi:PREDICTED: uncharacterized protein LOC109373595 [Hipposideros armiger]|uniref:Uncharacterized protein LOC109373595 n=1 Tax=Hipposideros armiger TaxID=186990 RepID=A0A8B7Q3W9_HIPAR|nr:PREDICTED: uncharacterized protein LOC109373595 [Hipposideros armiger]